jgi:hypothetical protein
LNIDQSFATVIGTPEARYFCNACQSEGKDTDHRAIPAEAARAIMGTVAATGIG